MSSPQVLQLGDVSVTVDGIDLRDVRWQGHEAVRRIYPVFQDKNWTNRPFRIEESVIEEVAGSARISAHGTGSFDAEPLTWQVQATITEEGIDYAFRAQTMRPFVRNRLGMCVLHPMAAAGSACTVEHTDGQVTQAHLPSDISPHQPFLDMRAITHTLPGGGTATVRMLGETYEMEDHRNWTDASFKTYCTPISLPFPVEVELSDVIEQTISVTFTRGTPAPEPSSDVVHVDLSDTLEPLPALGLCLPKTDIDFLDEQARSLASLRLDHLRVDLDASAPGAMDRLTTAARCAERIGARLRVASTCDDPGQLSAFANADPAVVSRIDCWFVFSRADKVTPDPWADQARTALGSAFDDVPLGGGTDLYFTELNREPADPLAFDVLNFSINPQVHAFDDRTLIQNAMTQYVVACNAERLTEPARVSVAPITLRPRFNPNATDPASDVSNTALPSDVDARQRTYFAACWTAMSIKYLSAAGSIDSATYFETFGWKGISEGSAGSIDPVHFPSVPGELFPVWQVFAALSGLDAARTCASDCPEEVDALIAEGDSRRVALIANWTDRARDVLIAGATAVSVAPSALTVVDLDHNR